MAKETFNFNEPTNGSHTIIGYVHRLIHRLQQTATLFYTLQQTATPFYTLQHTFTHCNTATHSNTLLHTVTHCNTLQHTVTHCNTLQHTVTHCNTLLHTATHCNTLQHTATHFYIPCPTPAPVSRTCRCSPRLPALHDNNTCVCTRVHMCQYTHISAYRYIYASPHIRASARACIYISIYIFQRIRTCTHTHFEFADARFIPLVVPPENFSRDGSLLNILCKIATELVFENSYFRRFLSWWMLSLSP